MAVRTLYLDEITSAEGFPRAIEEAAPADAPTGNNTDGALFFNCPSSSTGYVQGTHNSSDTISGTTKPTTAGPNNSVGDCYRLDGPITGVFAATAWTLSFRFITTILAGTRTANNVTAAVSVRVFRSANADGSSATEITSGVLSGSSFTLNDTAQHTSSISWSPGALTLSSEYLFFKTALHVTTGSTNGVQTQTAVGSNASITTPDFTHDATVNVVGLAATAQLGNVGPTAGVAVVAPQLVATSAVGQVGIEVFYARDTGNTAYGWYNPFIGAAPPAHNVTVAVNGVCAAAQVGKNSAGNTTDAAFEIDAFQSNAFQEAQPATNVNVTGVQATAAVGDLTSFFGGYAIVFVSGVVATPNIFWNPLFNHVEFGYPVTGVQATAQVGTVDALAALVAPSVVATAQLGTVVIQQDLSFTLPRGLYDLRPARALLGAFTLQRDSSPAAGSVVAAAAVGSVVYESSISPAGLEASGVLGTCSLIVDALPAPAGVYGTGMLGQVAYRFAYALAGVAATPQVGTPVAYAPAFVPEPGVQTGSAVGNVSFIIDSAVHVAGVQSAALLNPSNIRVDADVAIAGLASIGQTGTTIEESAYAVLGVQAAGEVGTTSPTDAQRVQGVHAAATVGTAAIHNDYSVFVSGLSADGLIGVPEFPHLVPVDRGKMIYTRAPQPGH